MDSAKFKIEKKEAESKVVVTIAEGTPIPTIQALKMALVDSKGVVLDSKVLSATAESCECVWERLFFFLKLTLLVDLSP